MKNRKEHISVCIATHKRNELLRKLILSLLSQKINGLLSYSIIVVDNDKEEGAKKIVKEIIETKSMPIRYYSQPIKNIAITRNLAVDKSTGDYVAFIDDDEYPVSDWLYNLYVTLKAYDCDIVNGPVNPYFAKNTSRWIIKSDFFGTTQLKTGEDKYTRATNNCLIKKRLLDKYKNPFDPEYGLTGGEDSKFFSRVKKEGAKFCWSSGACVYEYVFPERTKILWIIRIAFHGGNTYMRVKIEGRDFFYIIYNSFQSISKIFVILFLFPIFALMGLYHIKYLLFFLTKLCGFFGQISAYFNYKDYMYK